MTTLSICLICFLAKVTRIIAFPIKSAFISSNCNGRAVTVNAECGILCLVAVCNCAVHKKCHDKVLGKCTGSAKDSRETKVKQYVAFSFSMVTKWLVCLLYTSDDADE